MNTDLLQDFPFSLVKACKGLEATARRLGVSDGKQGMPWRGPRGTLLGRHTPTPLVGTTAPATRAPSLPGPPVLGRATLGTLMLQRTPTAIMGVDRS